MPALVCADSRPNHASFFSHFVARDNLPVRRLPECDRAAYALFEQRGRRLSTRNDRLKLELHCRAALAALIVSQGRRQASLTLKIKVKWPRMAEPFAAF